MNGTASILLLFVAAGLLTLAGIGTGRWRGRPPSEHAMTRMSPLP